MSKTICFTIDIEPDFGGLLTKDVYFGLKDLPKLEDLINRYEIKLTAFVTGKTLDDNPSLIDRLLALDVEIESHSYYHRVEQGSKIDDIEKGINAYVRVLGKVPLGYRAPQGIITMPEIDFLLGKGVKFDSSIFPAYFPGRYNRLRFPTGPFVVQSCGLLELPFSVIPTIRVPISLSYIQLLGLDTFKAMFKMFGLPELVIFDFHSYELGKVQSYNKLPASAKIGYLRSQKMYKDPCKVLEDFILYVLKKGYESKHMAQVYHELKHHAPRWNWRDD